MTLGPLEGRIAGDFVFFDRRRVRDRLRELLTGPLLTGRVDLVSSEHDEVRVWVELDHGSGTLFLELATAAADGECGVLKLTTDQASLGSALRDLDRLAAFEPC